MDLLGPLSPLSTTVVELPIAIVSLSNEQVLSELSLLGARLYDGQKSEAPYVFGVEFFA